MMTNNSAEESGPSGARATPGASPITRVLSREKPLTISLSAPLRRTIAASGEPEAAMARRKPTAMDSTPTSTATTPATPNTAAATEPRRCGILRTPKVVIAPTCESQLTGPAMLDPPQSIGHSQAHGLQGRKNSSDQPKHQAQPGANE